MKKNLTGLIDLQKIDKELHTLEALKGDMPQQVDVLRSKLAAREIEHDEKKQALVEVKKERALLESELAGHQDKQKKYQGQLYAVTSNREYDAITAEIETIGEKIDTAEEAIIVLLEQEDSLTSDIAEIEPDIPVLQEILSKKEHELDEQIRATEVEFRQWEKRREELKKDFLPAVIYQYERIRKGVGNTVLAEIHKGVCGGCHSFIPPQKRVEIRTMEQLILCEHCGRILVYSEQQETLVS